MPEKALAIGSIAEWFEKAVPQPSKKNCTTQLGVHFEEIAEMLDVFGSTDHDTDVAIKAARSAMQGLSRLTKERGMLFIKADRQEELLDAFCDQVVTGVGSSYMLGMDITGALEEVNASNWSKFIDGKPLFDDNKKIMKGPDYFRPSLGSFVNYR